MNNIILFETFTDELGSLTPIEYPKQIPFPIKRVYYIYNVNNQAIRGHHSHKKLRQILIAVNGSIKIKIQKGEEKEEIIQLNDPSYGLYVGPMVWREMFDFSNKAVLLVLASQIYDEKDYIRDYNEYIRLYKKYIKKEE